MSEPTPAEVEETRESPAGFHYVSYFIENPYGWYLRYIRGLRYRWTKPALLLGSALHGALEDSYTTHSKPDTLTKFRGLMQASKEKYEETENYNKDLNDGLAMLSVWCDKWITYDQTTYNILHLEEKFSIPLPNGYYLTVKPDLIVERKTDHIIRGIDHKSTRYSMSKAHESLAGQDQSTCYLFAIRQLYPNRTVDGIESDVLYKNRSVVKAERVGIIQRSDRELAEFQLGMIGALSEMVQKVKALADGYPVHLLFPRNGKDESYFSHEWPHIYRSKLPDDPLEPPFGYEIDTWTQDYTQKIVSTVSEVPVYE